MSGEEAPQSGITKGWRCFRNLHLPHCPMVLMGERGGVMKLLYTALNDRGGYHHFTPPVLQIWRSTVAALGLGIAA